MIVRNDYMMRAIAQMADAYLKAAGQTHDQLDNGTALTIVDNALANTLGTRAELIGLLGTDLIDGLDPTLRAHAARLLGLRARILADLSIEDSAAHALRLAHWALMGLLDHHFEDEDRDGAAHVERLMKHPLAIRALRVDEVCQTYVDLFAYHESNQRFARAEDNLFHALSMARELESSHFEALRERGLEFYDHLLTLTDEMLHHGGLPRSEAEDARRELLGLN